MQVQDLYYKKYLKYKNKYLNLLKQIGGFKDIKIKGTVITLETTEITFNSLNGSDLNTLIENIKYLTNLTHITLEATTITLDQAQALAENLKTNIVLLTLINCTIGDEEQNILKKKLLKKLIISKDVS